MNDLDTRLRHMAREEETPVPKDFDENLTRTLAQLPARKRRRIPRAVLLAACLVLVLTGAVLAAESGVFARFVDKKNMDPALTEELDASGMWQVTTSLRMDTSALSPQVQSQQEYKAVTFDTWQEANDYLGGVLPSNPFMAERGFSTMVIGDDRGRSEVEGRFIIRVSKENGKLSSLSVLTGCTVGDVLVTADILIYTENYQGDAIPLQVLFTDTSLEYHQLEDHITPSGNSVIALGMRQRVSQLNSDGSTTPLDETSWGCMAVVPAGNAVVQLIAGPARPDSAPDEQQCLDALYQVADSFS